MSARFIGRLSRIWRLHGEAECIDAPGFALGGERFEAGRRGLAGPFGLPSRTSKRLTGFSPAELARRLPTDEAFWAYRLWL